MSLHGNQLPAVPASSESGKSNLFRNLFTLFVIPATASGLFLGARPAEAQNAYITDSAGVSVINTATNKVTTTITAGVDHSTGVAVTTDGSKVYVTREVGNSVSVISTATNSVIATVPVSGGAFGLAVSPDGSKVYVGVSGFNTNGNVSVIDAAKNTVTTTITVGFAPSGVAVTPDGKTVYVANFNSNTGVSVIDTATNTVTKTINIAGNFEPLAVTPDGTKVYVADINGGVSVIDTGSNTRTTTIAVGNTPVGLAVTRDSTKAYVANEGDGTVSVIDTAANTVTTTIGGLNGAVAFGMFIGPVPQSIRFASFSAELSASSFFRLEGAFTLAAKSNGINPVKDNVILQIGTFSFQIPPGSFRQVQKGTFVFTGTIDQVSFQALIVRVAKNRFRYNFNGTGLSLTPFSKVTVGLTIGINNGATLVTVSN